MLTRILCLVTALAILPVTLPAIVIAGQPALNHAPVAKNQSVKVAEDTTKAIKLKATDSDRDPLTYTIISRPAQGMLNGTPPTVTYTPNSNYFGPDSFTFSVNDGSVDSNVATVSINVTPVNDPPVALNQEITAFENTALTITLSGTDVEGVRSATRLFQNRRTECWLEQAQIRSTRRIPTIAAPTVLPSRSQTGRKIAMLQQCRSA